VNDSVRKETKVAKEERRRKLQTFHREHILKAAMSLVEKSGMEGLTMEEVARVAGFSVGSLYNYFRSKDELAVELLVLKTAEIQQVLEAVPPMGLDARAVLTWYTVAILKKIRESKGVIMELLVRIHEAGSRATGLDHKRLHSLNQDQESHLGDLVKRVLAGQKLRVPPEDVGCAFGGLIRSFMVRSMMLDCESKSKVCEPNDSALAERIVDLLWNGIAA